jgi:hypothetical protein
MEAEIRAGVKAMKHRRGIDLVRVDTGSPVGDGSARSSRPSEPSYRVEVWTKPPEASGELLETISLATDFAVSTAAYRAALQARPGKTLVHMNGRHRMSCEAAEERPRPEPRRPSRQRARPAIIDVIRSP